MIAEIRRHFATAKRERAQRAIEYKRQQEEWRKNREEFERNEAICQREYRERAHVQALVTAKQERENALFHGAILWRAFRGAEDFVDACETRWRLAQSGGLTREQTAWTQWARSIAMRFNPFEYGYPDPIMDGALSAEAVPFGDPYPMAFSFPDLPAAARVLAAVSNQSVSGVSSG